MEKLIIVLVVMAASYLLCGFGAVYLAGVLDGMEEDNLYTKAPIALLFWLGPFGLILCLIVLLVLITSSKTSLLNKVYELGRGKK